MELVTGPGETAEVRAIVRRLLREAARGIAFEDMGVILPRPSVAGTATSLPVLPREEAEATAEIPLQPAGL